MEAFSKRSDTCFVCDKSLSSSEESVTVFIHKCCWTKSKVV